ncbi:MAG: PepSY domain-containing protein [Azoarcus sp.]|jgi:uncharacterized iron-regulated membrane protein|nr:PepSY domain-containing protein [Azoarcus sp.]
MRFDQPRGLRQSMSWLHTWSGLVLGWFLFAIFVTGTLSFFRNEITFWMQPELHRADKSRVDLDRALQVLAREAPHATQWSMTFPSSRNPTLGLSWQIPAGGESRATAGEAPREGGRDRANAPRERKPAGEGAENGAGARAERGGERGNPAFRESAKNLPGAHGEDLRQRADGQAADSARGSAVSRAAQAESAQQQQIAQAAHSQAQGGSGHGRDARVVLDPATGERLQGRTTAGGNFLYRFHFELYGMDRLWGRWIIGIATMFMFIALISGVIVHRNIFKDFFTFRPARGKRSWIDAHAATSVLSLPFHIVITFSGLLLFGPMMIPTAMQGAYGDNPTAYMQAMRARNLGQTSSPSGERAPLTDLKPLYDAARLAWPERGVGSLTITHPGDRGAIVEFRQPMMGGSLAAGRSTAQTLKFDGATGERLDPAPLAPPTLVQSISNVLIMLHRGFFASPVPRWLLFLAGVGGSLMIATGMVMWRVARQKKQEKTGRTPFGHRLVEISNVAGIAGLLVATAAYFWANRLIPADLPGRADWEIRVFFIAWAAMLVHALLRRHKAAWVEQLACAGFLTAALPFVNAFTGGLPLPASIALGQGLLAGFDLCALFMGIGFFYAAWKVCRHVPRVRREVPEASAADHPADADGLEDGLRVLPVEPLAPAATHLQPEANA